jgi:urea transporter
MRQQLRRLRSHYWLQATLNSYSLIFFSTNNVLAAVILLVTFFSPAVGLSGFLAVALINAFAYLAGFNRDEISKGLFGFNALFLGLAMGYDFQFSTSFWLLFVTAIITLLLVTVWLKGLLGDKNLPFLSFPFIVTYWIVSLSALHFSSIHLDENHIYAANEAMRNEGSAWYRFVHSLDDLNMPLLIVIYFKTLAGSFFQASVLGGILIAMGILYFSRIAFSLSILGFALACCFYNLLGADINELYYNLAGANFIFMAIGIGCFFVIPNIYSYLSVALMVPVLLLLLLFLGKLIGVFNLKAYSLSFSVLTTAFLFVLNQRWLHSYLKLVTIQYFSPEKTLYKFLVSEQRFKYEHLYKISLPFTGEWNVSQAYDGKITHLGDWSKALDFVIVDSKNNTYREPATAREGFGKENFYCYNKEIVAPFDGFVYDIINTVEENDVGEVNTDYNWGNTIILNHLNGLFSQISHIKKDSFGVVIGQYVTRGTFLATCGNSGRSPEPHIHFQLQSIPTIGAKTLSYPIGYYIERIGAEKFLRISEVPAEKSFISNVNVNELLIRAFTFLPGQKIHFVNEVSGERISWEVFTDAWNRTYIHCAQSDSYAYFVNDGIMLYFTDFEGDKQSLLFHFYLALYRQLLGFHEKLKVNDQVPLIHFGKWWARFLQDFAAPFYLFTRASFASSFTHADNIYAPQYMLSCSTVEAKVLNTRIKRTDYELELKDGRLHRFSIYGKSRAQTYFQQIVES